MDPENSPKKFSFPNSDQIIPGVNGGKASMPVSESNISHASEEIGSMDGRPVVHILDALNQHPTQGEDAKTIRTYQADIADAIRNDNVSMIKVALAEKKRQEKRGGYDETILEDKKSKTLYVALAAGAFLIVMVAAGSFMYFFGAEKTVEILDANNAAVEPIIYAESRIGISVDNRDGDDIARLVRREKEEKVNLGEIKEIVLTTGTSTRPIATQEFFAVTRSRIPDNLARSLRNNFMLGLYSFSPYDTFAIFKVGFYDNAFAGMLEWENTISSDIGNIFITRKPAPQPVRTATSTSSSTTNTSTNATPDAQGTTNVPSGLGLFNGDRFIDRVIQNKDARVLIDQYGNTLMLYTFLDKETLVISSSDKALKEILFRLTTGRIVR